LLQTTNKPSSKRIVVEMLLDQHRAHNLFARPSLLSRSQNEAPESLVKNKRGRGTNDLSSTLSAQYLIYRKTIS